MSVTKPERTCCKMEPECKAPAEWFIWTEEDGPYGGTDACTEHVGELLTDAPLHQIHAIRDGETQGL